MRNWLLIVACDPAACARFWVEAAKPPEDYIYENLHYSRFARYTRMVGCLTASVFDALDTTAIQWLEVLTTRRLTGLLLHDRH
jgi:hypothetical protein